MDSAGRNRYELLSMDDDVSDSLDNLAAQKKQPQQAKPTGVGASSKSTKPQQANKKQPNQAEKENKPSAMNKNEANKRSSAVAGGDKLNGKPPQGVAVNSNRKRNAGLPSAGTATEGAAGGQGRNANFRQLNGETREQRNNRRNTRENGFNNAGGAVVEGGQQPRQYRDRGENRGPPRQRNFEGGNNFRGKREFDRQSGSDKTGVKATDKRDGAGAHNWGSFKQDLEDVNGKATDSTTEGANNGEKGEDSGHEQQGEQTALEEETKELTLDEWKAQKQQRVKPQFNIRKAGEGEDTSQWKKMVALNNNKRKENESEEELEYDPAMYPQRVGRQQRVLDIQFNFNDGRRGGGGFSGRGRGRGGLRADGTRVGGERSFGPGGAGAAGGQRGGFDGGVRGGRGGGKPRNFGGERQQSAAFKVNDERQFPTLA